MNFSEHSDTKATTCFEGYPRRATALCVPIFAIDGQPIVNNADEICIQLSDDGETVTIHTTIVDPDFGATTKIAESVSFPTDLLLGLAQRRKATKEERRRWFEERQARQCASADAGQAATPPESVDIELLETMLADAQERLRAVSQLAVDLGISIDVSPVLPGDLASAARVWADGYEQGASQSMTDAA